MPSPSQRAAVKSVQFAGVTDRLWTRRWLGCGCLVGFECALACCDRRPNSLPEVEVYLA